MLCPFCLRPDVDAFEPTGGDPPALRCPACRAEPVPLVYPRDYAAYPALPLAIVGDTGHGKTAYIEALITHLEEVGVGPNSSFAFIDQAGMATYRRRLRELREFNQLPEGTRSVFPTPQVVRLGRIPLVGGCQLIVYDTGGEVFGDVELLRTAGRYVAACRAVVWIVSLTDLEHPAAWADRMTVYAEALVSLGTDPRAQTLIVALTKGDRFAGRNDFPDEARRFLDDDTLNPLDGAFERLERLSNALDGWLAGRHRNAVNLLSDRFGAVRYCVLSALGAEPAENGMVVGVAPRGVLAPLYWLWREALPAAVVEHGDTRTTHFDLVAAVAAAPSGATIHLGPHIYAVATRLEFRRPIRLTGQGKEATVIRSSASRFAIGIGVATDQAVGLSRLTIEHVGGEAADCVSVFRGTAELDGCAVRRAAAGERATGNGITVAGKHEAAAVLMACIADGNQGHGVAAYETGRLTLRNSEICSNGLAGIHGAGAAVTVESCRVLDNRQQGVHLCGTGAATVSRSTLGGNRAGIAVVEQVRVTLVGNTCEGNRRDGIVLRGDAEVEMARNRCVRNERSGVTVHDRVKVRGERNVCQKNIQDGVMVEDQAAAELTNNDCTENGRDGVRWAGAARGRCAENTCSYNAGHGVAVLDGAMPAVEANRAEANGGAGFSVHSTGRPTFARTNVGTANGSGDLDPPNLGRRGWW